LGIDDLKPSFMTAFFFLNIISEEAK